MPKFIYLFLDGVGLGPDNLFNPFSPQNSPLIFLDKLLGASLLAGLEIDRPDLLLKPVDPILGISGLPQSATGQTALYTGRNAPAFLGRHLSGFANGSLRILIEESGLFKQVLEAGGTVTSANLYTPGYFEAIKHRKLRLSAGALLSLTAGVPFRMPEDYEREEALFWDITNQYIYERSPNLSPLSPQEAGKRLALLGSKYDVTLFECYLPDFAGHSMNLAKARQVLEVIDGFIEGILDSKAEDLTLIISSDHGNIENLEIKTHTFNPVPLLVAGPEAKSFRPVKDITGIVPVIVDLIKAAYQ